MLVSIQHEGDEIPTASREIFHSAGTMDLRQWAAVPGNISILQVPSPPVLL